MGGGWLVSADIAGLGWRNAFFINVPICLLVLALSPAMSGNPSRSPFGIDWQGTVSLALILCCLLFPMALGRNFTGRGRCLCWWPCCRCWSGCG
jgi:MFS family permease